MGSCFTKKPTNEYLFLYSHIGKFICLLIKNKNKLITGKLSHPVLFNYIFKNPYNQEYKYRRLNYLLQEVRRLKLDKIRI